jgi:hypothetical protein
MRLPSAPLPHLLPHWPELAPRIRVAARRGLLVVLAKNRPKLARCRLRNPADIAPSLNRLQEELP